MAAVTNTTPLNLILIGAVDVLPQLYGRVFVPEAVMDELQHARTPEAVRVWAQGPPSWLEVIPVAVTADASLADLEAGEREAVLLTEQVGADLLIIDERDGREVARRRGLNITGTLGVLDRAADHGLIDFRSTVERLQQTTFRIAALLQPFLDRDAGRGQRPPASAEPNSE